jgi:hypothetical protein
MQGGNSSCHPHAAYPGRRQPFDDAFCVAPYWCEHVMEHLARFGPRTAAALNGHQMVGDRPGWALVTPFAGNEMTFRATDRIECIIIRLLASVRHTNEALNAPRASKSALPLHKDPPTHDSVHQVKG